MYKSLQVALAQRNDVTEEGIIIWTGKIKGRGEVSLFFTYFIVNLKFCNEVWYI